jgi:hypothetical protein
MAELGLLCAPLAVAGIWKWIKGKGGGKAGDGGGDDAEGRVQDAETSLPRTERTTVPMRIVPLPDAAPEPELEGEAWQRWRSLITWAKCDEDLPAMFCADVGAIIANLTGTRNMLVVPEGDAVSGELETGAWTAMVSRYLSTVDFFEHPRRTAMHLMILLAAFRKMQVGQYEGLAQRKSDEASEARDGSRGEKKLLAEARACLEHARFSSEAWRSAANAAHLLGEGKYVWVEMHAREAVKRGRGDMGFNGDIFDYVAGVVGAYANLCESRRHHRGLWNTTVLNAGRTIIEGLRHVYGKVPAELKMIADSILAEIADEMERQSFFDPLWPLERRQEARDMALEAYIRRGEYPSPSKVDPSFASVVGNAIKISRSRNMRLSNPRKKRWYPVDWEDYPKMEAFERMVLVASTILNRGCSFVHLMGYRERIFRKEDPLDTIERGSVMRGMSEVSLSKAVGLGLDAGIPLGLILECTLPAFWIGKEVEGCAREQYPDVATLHDVSSIMSDLAARSTVQEERVSAVVGALNSPAQVCYGPVFGRIKPLVSGAYFKLAR